jgi:hypothetical protein
MTFADGFFAAAMLIVLALVIWNWHPRRPVTIAEPAYSETVTLVLEMLKDGRGWVVDKYRATHPTGASIWIANDPSDAALALVGPVWPASSDRANAVTTTKHERRALFAAAKALLDRRQAAEIERATSEWAGRVTEYADNVVNIRGAA